MQIRTEIVTDSDNLLVYLRFFKGTAKKPYKTLEYGWDKSGARRVPSWIKTEGLTDAEITALINHMWIENIGNIENIENIEDIGNIASLDLIDRITLIDAITSIGTIGAITDIQRMVDVHAINYVKNGFFETGDLRHWSSYAAGGASVVVEAEATPSTERGNYYVKLTSTVAWAYLWQFIEPVRTINCRASVLAKTDASAGTFAIVVRYTDGTTNVTNCAPNVNWTEYSVTFTADKVAIAIQINNTKDNSVVYIDNIVILPVQEDVRTKHDAKVYQFTAAGSAADGATVINNVANKVIKIHRMFLQSTVDAATNVYLYEETSGNLVTVNTTLNAREGRESAFVPAPACIGQTTTVNKKVLLKNAAAKQVYWEITYSVDDAS